VWFHVSLDVLIFRNVTLTLDGTVSFVDIFLWSEFVRTVWTKFTGGAPHLILGNIWQCWYVRFKYQFNSSSSYYGCTTLYAEFWPSWPIPSIFFYPGQGCSNLARLTSV
jgi:hypothetical protein